MSHLRSGDLNRLVSVQSRSTAQDTFGGQSSTWTEVKKVYAHIEAMSGQERISGAGIFITDITHEITVRYDAIFADPKAAAALRIVYNSRTFDIRAALNEDERDRLIVLQASEGPTQG
jgi:SPP1 family predicted phage head-tail adaptor